MLDRHAHERAGRILAALVARVRAFADRPLDDLTVLVLKQLADPLPVGAPPAENPLKFALLRADDRR